MVLKNFGKRMAKGRTEGHVLAPRCGQCHLQPSPPGASIVFPGSQRQQFFHHSDGKRQRTLKITLDTRQRHLKASQCHQVMFCSESSKSSSSQAHCTLQEKPLVLGARPRARAGGVSVAVNGNLGKSGVAFALALVTQGSCRLQTVLPSLFTV